MGGSVSLELIQLLLNRHRLALINSFLPLSPQPQKQCLTQRRVICVAEWINSFFIYCFISDKIFLLKSFSEGSCWYDYIFWNVMFLLLEGMFLEGRVFWVPHRTYYKAFDVATLELCLHLYYMVCFLWFLFVSCLSAWLLSESNSDR